ncbi:histidine kinase [Streptomyces sp. NPDC047315]|uniref:sensor histidine kinase n=1 Tax=Streptomyces sp. NPDC047315 TaxID=3155142 RepID=UPI0033DDED79
MHRDRQALRRRALDLALWVLVCAPVLLNGDGYGPGRWAGSWLGSWWASAAGAALLGAAVAVGRRRPLAALVVALGLSAVHGSQLITPQYAVALVAFGFLAGRRSARARPALVLFAAVALAGLAVVLVLEQEPWSWFTLVAALLLAVVVPWLLGRFVRQYVELGAAGWRLADRMEREQRAVADRARLRERSRIAGDMHDSLGHELSLIALRAAALEVDRGLDERQRGAARELRQAAGDATARLRDIVGVLRGDDEGVPVTPRDEPVRALVERARTSGLAVTLHEEGEGDPLPEMAARAVHRIVQESLTNAAKHAPGAAVAVRVVRTSDEVAVTVTNDPAPSPSPAPAAPSGGTGLVGLHERARLAGGWLTHGPGSGDGFAVRARLPATAGASPAPPPAPTSAREWDLARRRVRRGLRQAIAVPVAAGVVLGVVMLGFDQYSRMRTVVHRADYDAVRVGDREEHVVARLPARALPDRPAGLPPEPRDADRCAYYRKDVLQDTPTFRFCFTDGRLSSKTVVRDVPNEEHRDG